MPATFKLFLKRTFTIEINVWRRSIWEISIMVILLIAASLITYFNSNRFVDNTKDFDKTREYTTTNLDNLEILTISNALKHDPTKYFLAYTPLKKIPAELTAAVAKRLSLNGTIGYPSEQVMETKFNEQTTLAGIVYNDIGKDDTLPKKLSIKIRFPSSFRTVEPSRTEERLWITRCSGKLNKIRDNLYDDYSNVDIYLREGFLQIEHQVFLAWYRRLMSTIKTEYGEPQVEMRFIHYNPNKYSCPVQGALNMHSIIYNFIFMLSFLNHVYKWSQLYEENVPTHDWHYGYEFRIQCLSNFLIAFAHMLILVIVAWILLFVDFKLVNTNYHTTAPLGLMLLAMIFSIIGLILCAMIFGRLFNTKEDATLFALCFWLANFSVFSMVLQREMTTPILIVPFIIFSNNLIPFAVSYYETVADQSTEIVDNESWLIFTGAFLNILVHLIILTYLINRYPGYYLSRSVLPLKSYKVPSITNKDRRFQLMGRRPYWDKIQLPFAGSETLLRLREVSAMYKKTSRKSVKSVNMRCYKGEIFVMLGPVGSGKVTLLRMLCGLKVPNRGAIEVVGMNFYEDLKKTRKVIDFRMTNNCLAEYLTVKQLMHFYVSTKLDEISDTSINVEYTKWWQYISSYIKSEDKLIQELNYGQRRLVTLCCCLATGTQVIILNEPACHLYAHEAIAFWNILEREKETRVIIVSTCSIDDTERIANRIGIFNMGFLEVCGTPFYLSSKFGTGVELVLLKKVDVLVKPITKFLKTYIPNIEPDNEIGDQLFYKISNSNLNIIQQMLIHLEKERKRLNIDTIRVMGSDLSDIYMKLVTSFRLRPQVFTGINETLDFSPVLESKRCRQQARAVFYKKYLMNPPIWWCVFNLFGTLILGLLTSHLGKSVILPTDKKLGIDLGYDGRANSRQFLPNADNCGFIELQETHKTRSLARNDASRLYNHQSFECLKGNYMSHLKNNKISKRKGMGAVEVENKQALIVYASQDIFHSGPMALNMLHNLILQFAFPNDTSIMATIENHPLSPPLLLKINLMDNHIKHMNQPLTLGVILPVTVSMFILPLVEEKARNVLILEIIAGLKMEIYWLMTFCWDFIIYMMATIIILLTSCAISNVVFTATEKLLIWFLICLCGMANLWFTYLMSMFFKRRIMRSFLVSLLVQLLFGIFLYVIYWHLTYDDVILFYIASLSPGFCLLGGISNIYSQSNEIRLCEEKCTYHKDCTPANMHEMVPQCQFNSYMEWNQPGVLQQIVFMILATILCIVSMYIIDVARKDRKYTTNHNLKELKSACYPFDDAEVADMKMKIADTDAIKCKQSDYFVDQLEAKIPKNKDLLHTMSFAVNKYNSMGIFGNRMCRKTHLIRQLVGEIGFSFGEVYVRGINMKHDSDKIQRYIGYCPQHSGYLPHLTGSQMIRYMCLIRGMPKDIIDRKTEEMGLILNMTGFLGKKIYKLTEEKRRKVGVALSLMTFNKILILDEPTYGLPATARREIWNILRYLRYYGRTIIFTTTDEFEAKTLADYIILFDKYEMLTIGSLQHTRHKYSRGFYFEVFLIKDGDADDVIERNLRKDIVNLERFVKFLHEYAELTGSQGHWLKYYIPVDKIIYSYLYGSVEKNKFRLNIFDYSIYEATTSMILQHIQEQRAVHRQRLAPHMSSDTLSLEKRPSIFSGDSGIYNKLKLLSTKSANDKTRNVIKVELARRTAEIEADPHPESTRSQTTMEASKYDLI